MLFKELSIGDIFQWNDFKYIKIAERDITKRMPNQYPNCINLQDLHYGVIGHKANVTLIKSPKQFPPLDSY